MRNKIIIWVVKVIRPLEPEECKLLLKSKLLKLHLSTRLITITSMVMAEVSPAESCSGKLRPPLKTAESILVSGLNLKETLLLKAVLFPL